jgi:hypothetical protein
MISRVFMNKAQVYDCAFKYSLKAISETTPLTVILRIRGDDTIGMKWSSRIGMINAAQEKKDDS